MKTGIFILSSKSRKSQLKNSLYFLFKNYNKTFNHDVFIMTPDYDDDDKDEISLSVRENNRSCINFKDINLKTPDNLDMDKVSKIISSVWSINWISIICPSNNRRMVRRINLYSIKRKIAGTILLFPFRIARD